MCCVELLHDYDYLQASFPCRGCGTGCGVHTSASGFISDGSGTSGYSNNAYCEWIIAPLGASQVMLRFTQFDIEPPNDLVQIFECNNVLCSQPQQVAELTGTYSNNYVMTSKTGFVKVIFRSDNRTNYDGFTALWSLVSLVISSCCGTSRQNVQENMRLCFCH